MLYPTELRARSRRGMLAGVNAHGQIVVGGF